MSEPLRILQFLRAPVGGLFRHVCDLSAELALRGHRVGLMCDANAAGPRVDRQLAELAPLCQLGIHRIPLRRQPGLGDVTAIARARSIVTATRPDIVHGHGAKGGAYARLAGVAQRDPALRPGVFYTPHGGSLHFDPASVAGRLFFSLERQMTALTDGLIFESAFALATYRDRVGAPRCPVRIVHNGLRPDEFALQHPAANAADFVFVGELRLLKGVDVLLQALARLAENGPARAAIVGNGPDAQRFRELADRLGLAGRVTFHGELPARQAFALGRCLVVPSRAESLPYIVLEAAAAGLPAILTDVGGIKEIVAGTQTRLIEPGAAAPLADEMHRFLQHPDIGAARAAQLRQQVQKRFSLTGMVDEIEDFYRRSLEAKRQRPGALAAAA